MKISIGDNKFSCKKITPSILQDFFHLWPQSIFTIIHIEILSVMQNFWCNKTQSSLDTIVHGDFWSANILFQYDEEKRPQKAFFVDFQQVGLGSPLRDILSLLYSSTDSAFRARYADRLLQHYFTIYRQFSTVSSSYHQFSQLYYQNRRYLSPLFFICTD